MVTVPQSFIATSTDPFEAPILTALREPEPGKAVGVGTHGEYRIYLHGDWDGVGNSNQGAKELLTAVDSCFEAAGIKPDKTSFASADLAQRIARAPEDGSQACVLTLDFKQQPEVHEKVAAALQRTMDASLAMRGAGARTLN